MTYQPWFVIASNIIDSSHICRYGVFVRRNCVRMACIFGKIRCSKNIFMSKRLDPAFKAAMRETLQASLINDAQNAEIWSRALEGTDIRSKRQQQGRDERSRITSDQVQQLFRLAVLAACPTRGEAMRLAECAARYAQRFARQTIGCLSAYRLADDDTNGRRIFSSLYDASLYFANDLAYRMNASSVTFTKNEMKFGYGGRARFLPADDEWRQAFRCILYLSRRGDPQAACFPACQWPRLVEMSPPM